MEKKPLIIGNWKMYKTLEDAMVFIRHFLPLIADCQNIDTYLSVPFTALHPLKEELGDKPLIQVGAQNMNDASEGAYTGEIAASMLINAGAQFVILGHSERRQYFFEDDAFINKKLKRARESQLEAILCIGESKEQKQSGQTLCFLKEQLTCALKEIEPDWPLSIAYEPLWAIGSGQSATPEVANETLACIKEELISLYGKEKAESIRLLYGGSVKPSSAPLFMSQEHIEGLLVGGASLSPETFSQIVNYQKESL